MSVNINYIRPQKGYQLKALSSKADIVIGGGAAGLGKTWTMIVEPLRHVHVTGFGAVVFRRTSPQIKAEGGLWDASEKIYNSIDAASGKRSNLEWSFPSGVKIKFSHLEYDKNVFDWQGSEIPLICFDELTHFTKKQFFYLLSRNRSVCGVKPYIRATCNPDPDSWVRQFIDWFIGDDGYPIPERNGVLRYFVRDDDNYIWGSSPEEVIEKAWHLLEPLVKKSGISPHKLIKSMTFITGSIYDNKALLSNNPEYLGNLNAQGATDKARLLHGNWNVKVDKADIYNYKAFQDMFTNEYIKKQSVFAKKYISTDIAMKGSDKFVVFVWQGKMLIDFIIIPKTKGNGVVNAIKQMANRHNIQYRNIVFDNDGVGSFVDGYIPNAQEFNNGARPIDGEMYFNLKSQCFFKSGDAVENGEYYIPQEVANRPYDDKMTLKERLIFERKAIKQMINKAEEGKLRVLPKAEMKVYLDGQSPDLMDAFMMREYLDLTPGIATVTYSR